MWDSDEIQVVPKKYGCQILITNASIEQIKDKSLPTDARLIKYKVDGKVYIDICRSGKVVNIFDLYYDKFGPGALLSIDFGYGTVNPKIWGFTKEKEKGKK